ncbi:hypothetical protein CHLRE_04g217952v5 [Chlamydomonas reinhardtii]|uniref:C2HC/C3H-type domain-containing protein n=1 Tax=Chlamydomonas reinhardtii TaxID=3055 RepID=A0A2K3DTI5_CHLRE|nr:uncharacterized protein CHLRE_04g217952v5 [Chlamydomonas reinhardtii]PNW83851.1 hypothetical protein CHLRE_04g217952v5 [Chlamydomonas reinhardtii]
MERNYAGGYSGGGQPSNLVSSGRRAGTVRTGTPDAAPAAGGYAGAGAADDAASHQARFGRRASPGAYPSGGGMDMEPPRGGASGYTPSAAAGAPRAAGIPRSGAAAGAYSASPAASSAAAAAAAAAPPPGAAAAGPSSKLSGLQRLKEAAASRLVSRIPSGGRHAPESAGYVPSAMTHQAPARPAPLRAGSGGGGGASSGTSAAGRPPSTGSSGYGYSSSAAAGAAAGRPGSGRSASTGAALGAGSRAPGASSGYGYGSSAAGTSSTSASGRPPSGSGAASAAAASAARPSALASLAARRQQTAEPAAAPPPRAPPAAAPPPRAPAAAAPPPRGLSGPIRAPPPPAPAPSYGGGGGGYGGGGGFSGGGGGFDAGTIPPGADDPGPTGPMVECPSCGRRFNEQAYSKHAKICEKVFAQKRKPVNMAAKRLEGSEAAKFFDMRKGVPKSEAKGAAGPPGKAAPGRGAGAAGGTRLDDRPLPGSKMPKWKAQSEQLRQAMAANKRIADAAARGVDIKDVKFTPTPAEQDDRVPCPHCGRKFAELTAERHIPKCRDILAKPKFLGAKSGRGAHVRR